MHHDHDISYYRDLYLLHAESPAHRKQVERSREIMSDFFDLGIVSTVNVSGGKDSTAMMHLAWTLNPDIHVVSEKDGMDFPGEVDFMLDLRRRYNLFMDIITPEVNLWDVMKDHDFTEDIHSAGTDFSDAYFYAMLRDFQQQHRIKGVMLGLRAQESKAREWNVKTHGTIYYNRSWKHIVCQPLAHWSAKDVFAYLCANDVPILDLYFKTKYTDGPESIRKSWILPSHQSSRGQALWLKYYYPDLYLKLSAINPKMRAFV